MKIVLIGYMGSGKSTVGRELSNLTGFPFYDLDAYIEEQASLTIPQIFASKGEVFFRKLESKCLINLLVQNQKKPIILSLGGGTPCYADNMELIKNTQATKSFYLKLGFQSLAKRLWDEKNNRPLIASIDTLENLQDYIRKHLFERQFFYHQADCIINAEEKNIRTIAKEIQQTGLK